MSKAAIAIRTPNALPCSAAPLAALVALVICLGCGKEPEESLPETFPVSGKVVSRTGQPLAGGSIQFQSRVDPAISAIGEIDSDGSFSLFTHVDGNKLPGTIEGPHDVTVIPESDDQPQAPATLRKPYSVLPQENELTITLE